MIKKFLSYAKNIFMIIGMNFLECTHNSYPVSSDVSTGSSLCEKQHNTSLLKTLTRFKIKSCLFATSSHMLYWAPIQLTQQMLQLPIMSYFMISVHSSIQFPIFVCPEPYSERKPLAHL